MPIWSGNLIMPAPVAWTMRNGIHHSRRSVEASHSNYLRWNSPIGYWFNIFHITSLYCISEFLY